MREALRRLLWVIPTLAALSLAAFWLFSSAEFGPKGQRAAAEHERIARHEERPLFFNPSPRDARELAEHLMRSVAAGGPESKSAARELVRGGGALLPYILPRLDELAPEGRLRVALALAPIAERMDIGTAEELTEPASAVLFWNRFWQDRSVDFRPTVVRRLVQRVSRRSLLLRRKDIVQLDTFALPELMRALGRARSRADVERIARLTELASHVTERDVRVDETASLGEANAVVLKWVRWWGEHRSDYLAFEGVHRIGAMFLETEYGRWAVQTASAGFGAMRDGRSVMSVMRARARGTLSLLGLGLVGGYLLGIAAGLLSERQAPRTARILGVVSLALASISPVALAGLAQPRPGNYVWAGLILVLLTAARVMHCQRTALRVRQSSGCLWLPARASFWQALSARFRQASTGVLALAASDIPALLSSVFLLEWVFALDGLGPVTFEAIRTGDITWLMGFALVSAATVALIQIASDALLGKVDRALGVVRRRGQGVLL